MLPWGLALLLAVSVLLGLCLGSSSVSPMEVLRAIACGDKQSAAYRIMLYSRLPRVLGAVMAGSALRLQARSCRRYFTIRWRARIRSA